MALWYKSVNQNKLVFYYWYRTVYFGAVEHAVKVATLLTLSELAIHRITRKVLVLCNKLPIIIS